MPRTTDRPDRTDRPTTTCFSPTAAPCPPGAVRQRRGNVVRISDLPRVTQGRIATRLAGTASSGRRLPAQRGR